LEMQKISCLTKNSKNRYFEIFNYLESQYKKDCIGLFSLFF
jgi:hypothetical protein